MKKKVIIDGRTDKELEKFSGRVREEFEKRFSFLRTEGRLDFPEARKVTKYLFEIRIKFKGEYRGFYAYVGKTYIIILHIFRKKTQRTPVKNVKVAERRLKEYGQ